MSRLRHLIVGIALSAFAGAASAEPPLASEASQRAEVAAESAVAPLEDAPLFATARTADDRALARATARADLSIVATSKQTATVSDSSVDGTSTTGDLRIADTAFQNATGLTIVNSNTGNNVAMNSSLNVNIVLAPPQ